MFIWFYLWSCPQHIQQLPSKLLLISLCGEYKTESHKIDKNKLLLLDRAENLVCDPNNNMLWVSDNSMGTISTISDSKISDDYRTVVHLGGPTGTVETEIVLSNKDYYSGQSFESITGLALNKDSTILYAAAEIKNATTDDKEYFIIAVNMEQKQSYEVVTQIPEVYSCFINLFQHIILIPTLFLCTARLAMASLLTTPRVCSTSPIL